MLIKMQSWFVEFNSNEYFRMCLEAASWNAAYRKRGYKNYHSMHQECIDAYFGYRGYKLVERLTKRCSVR